MDCSGPVLDFPVCIQGATGFCHRQSRARYARANPFYFVRHNLCGDYHRFIYKKIIPHSGPWNDLLPLPDDRDSNQQLAGLLCVDGLWLDLLFLIWILEK